jgi:hypothetical protein
LLGQVTIPVEIRSKIAQVTASHSIWRKHVGFGHVTVDLSWKAGWPPLADAVLQLLEKLSMKKHCYQITNLYV